MKYPTEIFEDLITDGGTPVAVCEFCDKTWFDALGEFMDEDELDRLVAKQKKAPEKYKSLYGTVSIGHLWGRQYVIGCRCEQIARFEGEIWRHRNFLARYLSGRREAILKSMESLDGLIDAKLK